VALPSASDDSTAMFFEYQVEGRRWTWSGALRALHGLGADEEPTTQVIVDRMVEQDRPLMLSRFRHHLEHEGPYSCVFRMTDSLGHLRRVMFVGQSEAGGGTVKRLSGFVVDLTETMRDNAREAVEASAEHRAAIEQAKGALMLSFCIDAQTAFELLKGYSSQTNIKVAVLAASIVAGLSDPTVNSGDPVKCLLDVVIGLGAPAPSLAAEWASSTDAG